MTKTGLFLSVFVVLFCCAEGGATDWGRIALCMSNEGIGSQTSVNQYWSLHSKRSVISRVASYFAFLKISTCNNFT